MFGNSPYLSEALLAEPDVLARVAARRAGCACGSGDRAAAAEPGDRRARLMAALRLGKRRLALLTALADIAGLWPLEQVTEALTRFADLAVGAALELLLREAASAASSRSRRPDGRSPSAASSSSAWASSARSS